MKKILIVVVVLVVIMAAILLLNNRKEALPEGMLMIVGPTGNEVVITSFPEDKGVTLTTADGEFQAVPVSAFLGEYLDTQDWGQMIFTAADKAEVTIKRDELSGLFLEQISENGVSFLRLIVPLDGHSQRWLKNVTSITLK
jgi:hypothetical protein